MDLFDFTDLVEFLDYFIKPWRFLVSATYRSDCFLTWAESTCWKRIGLAVQVAISVACGVVLPTFVIYSLVVS